MFWPESVCTHSFKSRPAWWETAHFQLSWIWCVVDVIMIFKLLVGSFITFYPFNEFNWRLRWYINIGWASIVLPWVLTDGYSPFDWQQEFLGAFVAVQRFMLRRVWSLVAEYAALWDFYSVFMKALMANTSYTHNVLTQIICGLYIQYGVNKRRSRQQLDSVVVTINQSTKSPQTMTNNFNIWS